jgi:hypothetical protein
VTAAPRMRSASGPSRGPLRRAAVRAVVSWEAIAGSPAAALETSAALEAFGPSLMPRAARMQDSGNHMYSGQYVADRLRRLGFPELADVALRELPDPVDADQLENWGMRYGVSKDDLISRMGGSP